MKTDYHLLAQSASFSLPMTREIIGLVMLSRVKALKSSTLLQIAVLRHFSFLATTREAARTLLDVKHFPQLNSTSCGHHK